jgi:hypothetical protein
MVTCSAGKNQSGWLGSGGHIHSQAIGVMLGQAEKGLHSVQLAVSFQSHQFLLTILIALEGIPYFSILR